MWPPFSWTSYCILCTAFTADSQLSAGILRTVRDGMLSFNIAKSFDTHWTLGNPIAENRME